jgi:hypothetical protein
MHYKSYGTRKDTPSRMARKHKRREVFVANKKMAKARKKAARLERKALAESENE